MGIPRTNGETASTFRGRLDRRLLIAVAAIGLAGVLLLIVATTVQAYAWCTAQTPCADSPTHTYNYVSLTNDSLVAAGWGITRVDDTDMTKSYHSTCLASTDVCYRDDNYELYPEYLTAIQWGYGAGPNDPDAVAIRVCVTLISPYTTICDKSEVLFDLADIPDFTTAEPRMIGCHETGHTTGLQHSTSSLSCMQASVTDDGYFAAHDLAHINQRY